MEGSSEMLPVIVSLPKLFEPLLSKIGLVRVSISKISKSCFKLLYVCSCKFCLVKRISSNRTGFMCFDLR